MNVTDQQNTYKSGKP